MSATIHFVALGCPKNRVDTERMAGIARRAGLTLVGQAGQADVIVVNTCGFILPAKEESIDAVLEAAREKERGRCRTLIVAGCLSQRHPDELAAELPEVDHFVGTADLERLQELLSGLGAPRLAVGAPAAGAPEERFARDLGQAGHVAYLKIAEGCDRPCAFCIIPALRGPQRSRTIPSLVEEARALVGAGARELVLVAQDTTMFGRDLEPRVQLCELLQALGEQLEGLRWLRLLYAYPSAVDRSLIEALSRLPRVVPYLDLPFQHADDEVLRRMKRGYGAARLRQTMAELRAAVPRLHLRGTVICGHPGETAAAHRALLEFLAEQELEHLGAFPFSAEEGTEAATQPDQLPAELAAERVAEVMEAQRKISRRALARLRGQVLEVMVDGPSEESEHLLAGRHAGQAPEVDGVTFLADADPAPAPGTIVRARVTDSADYDLVARLLP